MTDRIELRGLQARGYHGVFAHERRQGQDFLADLVVWRDLRQAAASDDVADTCDYGVLAEIATAVLGGRPRNLIESVAAEIADRILQQDGIRGVEVTVHKPQAPIAARAADIAVVLYRGAGGELQGQCDSP